MTNEAVQRTRFSDPVDFTCADGTAISKGTLLKLTDPRTAIATSASGDAFAGICARDKIANDGRTQIAAYVDGIFDMVDSGAGITAGQLVSVGGVNTIKTATGTEVDAGKAIGKALETASAGETIQVMVGHI